MKASFKYASACVILVSTVLVGLWPFLDDAGRSGTLVAAAMVIPVQSIAFWALIRFRTELKHFLAVWIGGTLVRMAVIGIGAVIAINSGADFAIPRCRNSGARDLPRGPVDGFSIGGFFFGLLLLEPFYFRIQSSETVRA